MMAGIGGPEGIRTPDPLVENHKNLFIESCQSRCQTRGHQLITSNSIIDLLLPNCTFSCGATRQDLLQPLSHFYHSRAVATFQNWNPTDSPELTQQGPNLSSTDHHPLGICKAADRANTVSLLIPFHSVDRTVVFGRMGAAEPRRSAGDGWLHVWISGSQRHWVGTIPEPP